MRMVELSKEWLKKNGQKLKIAYSFAVANKLNIESKDDVLIILQKVNPENANEIQAGTYSKMLQLFRNRFRKTLKEKLEG